MSDYTSFVAMSQAEAVAYLDAFKHETPASLERLSTVVSVPVGLTRESLDDVWRLAAPQLSWREGYAPPDSGQPGRQVDDSELEAASELPSWFHHPSSAGYARFSADALWLIDGLARLLGEVAIHELGGQWAVGHARTRGYMFQNQPVVTGVARDAVSPMQSCATLAAGALSSRTKGPQTLRQILEVWAAAG